MLEVRRALRSSCGGSPRMLTCADVSSLCTQMDQTPVQRVRGMPVYEVCSSRKGTFAIRFTLFWHTSYLRSSPLHLHHFHNLHVGHLSSRAVCAHVCSVSHTCSVIHTTRRVLFCVTVWNTGPLLTPLVITDLTWTDACPSSKTLRSLMFEWDRCDLTFGSLAQKV